METQKSWATSLKPHKQVMQNLNPGLFGYNIWALILVDS